jgi:hypothetical protein
VVGPEFSFFVPLPFCAALRRRAPVFFVLVQGFPGSGPQCGPEGQEQPAGPELRVFGEREQLSVSLPISFVPRKQLGGIRYHTNLTFFRCRGSCGPNSHYFDDITPGTLDIGKHCQRSQTDHNRCHEQNHYFWRSRRRWLFVTFVRQIHYPVSK